MHFDDGTAAVLRRWPLNSPEDIVSEGIAYGMLASACCDDAPTFDALAAFYAAVAEGRLFDAGRGAFARTAAPGALDGEPTRWALGMQVGTAGKGEQRAAVLGHRGMGGSVGLCVPQAGVAIAVTVSQLSARRDATRRLLAVALEACGGWSMVEDL